MFKIKLPASKDKAKEQPEKKQKKALPKIRIAKPQPPSSSASISTATSSTKTKQPKTKAKQIKVKLKNPLPGIPQPHVKKAPRIRVKPTRIPGEGYDSEASDIEDDPLVEEAIILRLLPDAELDYVRHCAESGEYNNIHIKWKDKLRAVVYINKSMYAAKLINLPNIVEVQKTIDRKNIFKTVDVCQMLLVVMPIKNESEIENLKVEQGEVLPDGLTPPLNNIANSKYRRNLTNDYIDSIESKVDELLRLDEDAEDSQFELIDPESLNVNETPASTPAVSTPQSNNAYDSSALLRTGTSTTGISSAGKDHDGDLELELEQMLGDGDLILEDGDSVRIEGANGETVQLADGQVVQATTEDLEEEEEEEEVAEEEEEEESEDDDDDDDDDDDNSDNEQGASRKVEVDEDEQHNALLRDEINELLATIEQNKTRLEKTSNPLLQSRFIDSINKLEKELENKRRQLKTSEDKTASNKKDEDEDGRALGGDDEEGEGEDRVREDDEDEEDEEEDNGDNDEDDDLDDLFG